MCHLVISHTSLTADTPSCTERYSHSPRVPSPGHRPWTQTYSTMLLPMGLTHHRSMVTCVPSQTQTPRPSPLQILCQWILTKPRRRWYLTRFLGKEEETKMGVVKAFQGQPQPLPMPEAAFQGSPVLFLLLPAAGPPSKLAASWSGGPQCGEGVCVWGDLLPSTSPLRATQ